MVRDGRAALTRFLPCCCSHEPAVRPPASTRPVGAQQTAVLPALQPGRVRDPPDIRDASDAVSQPAPRGSRP
jgi:hypothetical protein